MVIKTSNVPPELLTLTKYAAEFFSNEFYTAAQRKRIDEIKVTFLKLPKKDDALAYCDYELPERGFPRDFSIEYNDTRYRDINIRTYISTLFHELTHVRQFAMGELRPGKNDGTIWKGKYFPSKTPYSHHPWEHEAYGLQCTAYQIFVEKHKHMKLHLFSPKCNGRKRSGWKAIKFPSKPTT